MVSLANLLTLEKSLADPCDYQVKAKLKNFGFTWKVRVSLSDLILNAFSFSHVPLTKKESCADTLGKQYR